MMVPNSKRGLTLIEVMVVMGLLLLLTFLLGDFLSDLARSSSVAGVRGGLQSEALLHSEAMLASLRQTTLTGLAVSNDPNHPGFAVTPLRTVTTGGQRVWDQQLTMYYWVSGSRTLYRQQCPPASLPTGLAFQPSQPPQPAPAELTSMFSGGRPLSGRVSDFEVALQGSRISLKLGMEHAMPNASPQRYEIVRELTMLSP
jgi:prepilin-type N-terminal cleavage/methylation domain-containing protein